MNNLHYSDEKNILLMVALLKAHNIRRVIASPGTTNITFIGSLMHDPFFEMYSSVDERSAAYIAWQKKVANRWLYLVQERLHHEIIYQGLRRHIIGSYLFSLSHPQGKNARLDI